MDTNNYIIKIIGTQQLDDDKDTVEVTTVGKYTIAPTGNKFIKYTEYDKDEPRISQNTTIKVSDNQITITRDGHYGSQLLLECGRRHQCHYATPAGDMIIGVFTHKMDVALNEKGGKLSVAYTLDFDSSVVSENTFEITISKN